MLPIKVQGAQPIAREIKPDKKYIFIFAKNTTTEEVEGFKRAAAGCMIDGILMVGDPRDLTIYEVEGK